VNTLFGYLCYAGAVGVLRLPLQWALLVSLVAGIIFNFHSYGKMVFSPKGRSGGWLVFGRFLLVYGATYGLNLWILECLTTRNVSPYLAQFLSLFAIVPITYVLLRGIVWRNTATQR
jgi:putative flippase GtrA